MQEVFGEKDRGQLRLGYEIYYKHYGSQSDSYFVKRYAKVQRPECGSSDARYGSNSGSAVIGFLVLIVVFVLIFYGMGLFDFSFPSSADYDSPVVERVR